MQLQCVYSSCQVPVTLPSVAIAFPASRRLKLMVSREIAHALGLTTGGTIGAGYTLSMDEAVKATQEMIDAARAVNSNVIVLAHGGPFEGPEQVAYVLERSDAQGFVGASSFERLPVEKAIVGLVKEFKKLRTHRCQQT